MRAPPAYAVWTAQVFKVLQSMGAMCVNDAFRCLYLTVFFLRIITATDNRCALLVCDRSCSYGEDISLLATVAVY